MPVMKQLAICALTVWWMLSAALAAPNSTGYETTNTWTPAGTHPSAWIQEVDLTPDPVSGVIPSNPAYYDHTNIGTFTSSVGYTNSGGRPYQITSDVMTVSGSLDSTIPLLSGTTYQTRLVQFVLYSSGYNGMAPATLATVTEADGVTPHPIDVSTAGYVKGTLTVLSGDVLLASRTREDIPVSGTAQYWCAGGTNTAILTSCYSGSSSPLTQRVVNFGLTSFSDLLSTGGAINYNMVNNNVTLAAAGPLYSIPRTTASWSSPTNSTFTNLQTAITASLTNIYPAATTYMQVYPGPYSPGTVGTIVSGQQLTSVSSVSTSGINYSFTATPTALNTLITSSGMWTFEVDTCLAVAFPGRPAETVLNGYITVNYNLTTTINSTLNTSH